MFFFFQAEDGIRDVAVTGVQTCALPISKTGQILLQNPLPGKRGNLSQRAVEGPGRWRFDANVNKSVKISETKNVQLRLDATDILNHPEANTSASNLILDINSPSFGLITGVNAKSTLHRQFQA